MPITGIIRNSYDRHTNTKSILDESPDLNTIVATIKRPYNTPSMSFKRKIVYTRNRLELLGL